MQSEEGKKKGYSEIKSNAARYEAPGKGEKTVCTPRPWCGGGAPDSPRTVV